MKKKSKQRKATTAAMLLGPVLATSERAETTIR
jgi:hypothetical protein